MSTNETRSAAEHCPRYTQSHHRPAARINDRGFCEECGCAAKADRRARNHVITEGGTSITPARRGRFIAQLDYEGVSVWAA